MPNHPAAIDPVILLAKLWNPHRPHSVVLEDFYYGRGLHWIMKLIQAIPMPNMWTESGSYKRLRVKKALDRIVDYLNKGENVLVYPSGRMMHSGRENLRAASGVFEVLSTVPDANVILIRTTGLIGSSFSWVVQQKRPNLWKSMYHGFIHVCCNLIIFTPRRKVIVEFEKAPPELSACQDKMDLNRRLEDWYNQRGDEPISLVSYSIWKKVYFELKSEKNQNREKQIAISQEIHDKVICELARKTGLEKNAIQESDQLERTLGLDSLAIAELLSWLDEEFYMSDVDPAELHTVFDVMLAAAGAARDLREGKPSRIDKRWIKPRVTRCIRVPDPDSTIHWNFLQICDAMKHDVALADDTTGVLSYRQAKARVLILADIFGEFPDKYIGVMLPASVAVTLVIFALQLAGKIPVMINWTLGDKNLLHVIEVTKTNTILTSARFLDKLDQFNVEIVENYLLILEDVGKRYVTLGRKIKGLYRARFESKRLTKIFPSLSMACSDPAVVLFTSGSETVPKGVPLSHTNVLSNIAGSIESVKPGPDEMLYAFLPPFHSFGFTVTTLLPLVSGIKVVFYPNPLERRRIASGISSWKPTMVCATPTFIIGIMKAARDKQLQSLRFILVGAEKAPEELFSKIKEYCEAEVLEGYGITECSPVLTLNRPHEKQVGVGRPIDGVKVRVVDPETKTILEEGKQGLILVRGPNVFGGYLDRDSRDAFVEYDGETWYVTGDLGFISPDHYLTISGRLKRFVKIGGEMISLPAMETALQDVYQPENGEPTLALSYLEKEGERPHICLFTTSSFTVEEINGTLKKLGFGNLARINQVIELEEIPVLGTGKTDHRQLKDLLKARSKTN